MSGKFVPVSNWQIFEKQSRGGSRYAKYIDEPVVIVSGLDMILSKLCYEMIGNPTHVRFLTDGSKRIGIVAVDEDDINGYKLNPPRNNGMISINAALFIRQYFGEKKGKPRVFRAEMDGEILVVALNQMPSAV